MSKIDIISGFLGAGKTTLIQKLLKESLAGTKVVLIENEFGQIGIDGGFLKEAGIEIKEMNSGCICCSLVGDFGESLKEVITTYAPERIIIEPSGVGKLSDVIKAVSKVETGNAQMEDVYLNSAVAVVDASKCKMYMKNFGEFFINQVESAKTIILSRTQNMSDDKLKEVVAMLREHNEKATIITTPWDDLKGDQILETMECGKSLEDELMAEVMKEHDENCTCGCHDHHHHDDEDEHEHHHHHHDDDDEDEHEHHHHHHDDDDEDEHEHHHHHHDHDEDEHEHHHHEHGEECTCGCHDHDHHHHHADEVFTSWGIETTNKYSMDEVNALLDELEDAGKYGFILRSKGMIYDKEGGFIYFDYVPGEKNVRKGTPEVTGKIVVIGSEIKEDNLAELFGTK
ncbi:MAG: GTP-binding protein [Lachnospiraceae bacterium]|nr:GTP-binding protein [Lachnospiraceae bacterium]